MFHTDMKLKDKKFFVYDIIDIIQNIYTYSTKKTPIFQIIAFTFFLTLKKDFRHK